MTVKELIDKLKEFPQDMIVRDYGHCEIENVRIVHWVDGNPPYEDEEDRLIIE